MLPKPIIDRRTDCATRLPCGAMDRWTLAASWTWRAKRWLPIALLAACAEEHDPATRPGRMESQSAAAESGAEGGGAASRGADAAPRANDVDAGRTPAERTPTVLVDPEFAIAELERIARAVDRGCTDECTIMMLTAPCATSWCSPLAVSSTTIRDVERSLGEVARTTCGYRGAIPFIPSDCSPGDLVAACRSGRCEVESSCPPGCMRDRGLCVDRDGGRCDGCPPREAIEHGAPCSTSGQDCYYPPACGGEQATCEPSDGGLGVWWVSTRLC